MRAVLHQSNIVVLSSIKNIGNTVTRQGSGQSCERKEGKQSFFLLYPPTVAVLECLERGNGTGKKRLRGRGGG